MDGDGEAMEKAPDDETRPPVAAVAARVTGGDDGDAAIMIGGDGAARSH